MNPAVPKGHNPVPLLLPPRGSTVWRPAPSHVAATMLKVLVFSGGKIQYFRKQIQLINIVLSAFQENMDLRKGPAQTDHKRG